MERVKTKVRLLNEDELGQWGIFISHSDDTDTIKMLCDVLEKKGIRYLWDKQIKLGSENFANEILEMIHKCVAAVVVISEKSMNSQWVNFEMGVLEGLGKNIYLFDTEGLLEKISYRYHFDKYLPVYSDAETLSNAVSKEKLFYSLFNDNETAKLTNDVLRDKIGEHIIPVRIDSNVPGLSAIPTDKYDVNSLIVNFGNFTKNRHVDGSICCQSREDIPDDMCEYTEMKCCMNFKPDRKVNPECVLLNRVWDNACVDGNIISIVLPLHKKAGTTFKMFIDTEYSEIADMLVDILDRYGLCPSHSGNGNQNRIYFTLKDNAINGLFKLKDEFENNFICPGAAQPL